MKMTESDDGYKLGRAIIALSEADRWDRARLEWWIEEIYIQREPETCLCGHFPINELCVLRNEKNGHSAIVGNVCVKKFMKLSSDKMFAAIDGRSVWAYRLANRRDNDRGAWSVSARTARSGWSAGPHCSGDR